MIDEIYQDWKWGSFKEVSPSARSGAFFDTASCIFFEIEKHKQPRKFHPMATLVEVKKAADELSAEEQAGLVAHLLASFSSAPLGPDDDEVDRREVEMDSGRVTTLSHDQFLSAVGRR
ncbi:hypothetical protein JIN84_21930 [Luteolibacter yonseiensis]|uniref:Uncharacterized protein n=1 Tax=Luteolibacter yonseiensis TaxID=1144680 RepID=A0A934R8T1_9BACT|nr:hypothetical protein [Luteolibacter yonseiensis]MBK1818296.1 hypothetical protein [Luteolibacter yonseiensis]